MTPTLLVIAGGTASGKTTLAKLLVQRTSALLISHDRYYRDCPEPEGVNFDHPDALDTDLLVAHLDQLLRGNPVTLPDYDFASHRRKPGHLVHPRPLIVVEGILAMTSAALLERANVRVFVHCPDDIRLVRRLERDCAERGRTWQSVTAQYLETVRPMHERFVTDGMHKADLILDGSVPAEPELERLLARLPGGAEAQIPSAAP